MPENSWAGANVQYNQAIRRIYQTVQCVWDCCVKSRVPHCVIEHSEMPTLHHATACIVQILLRFEKCTVRWNGTSEVAQWFQLITQPGNKHITILMDSFHVNRKQIQNDFSGQFSRRMGWLTLWLSILSWKQQCLRKQHAIWSKHNISG